MKAVLNGQEKPAPPCISERVRVARQHLDFSIRWKGDRLGIFEMRRHYANCFKAIPEFKPFRTRLVEADTFEEVGYILDEVLEQYAPLAVTE